jgi:hypothetical protein
MNSKLTKISIVVLLFSTSLNAQIKLTTNNMIGIGTSNPSSDVEIYAVTTKISRPNTGYSPVPIIIDWQYNHPRLCPNTSHTGYIGMPNFWNEGRFDYVRYTYSCSQYSDQKFKKNITPITKSLDKILQLNGVRYDLDFSSIGTTKEMDEKCGKNQLGLIAQDVLKVVPEVVNSDSIGYSIDYIKLIPLLIEALKEQQKEIETLQKLITMHEEEIFAIKKQLDTSRVDASKQKSTASLEPENVPSNNAVVLYQNTPNPFSADTKIAYLLPDNINKASIIIHDLQGSEVKQIEIFIKGPGNIVIHGSELKAGMYFYTLIADNSIIDTKRMILTE